MDENTHLCPKCGTEIALPPESEEASCPACQWSRQADPGSTAASTPAGTPGSEAAFGTPTEIPAAGLRSHPVLRGCLMAVVIVAAVLGLLVFIVFAGCLFLR